MGTSKATANKPAAKNDAGKKPILAAVTKAGGKDAAKKPTTPAVPKKP